MKNLTSSREEIISKLNAINSRTDITDKEKESLIADLIAAYREQYK